MESWKQQILTLSKDDGMQERRRFNTHLKKLQNDELSHEEVMKSVFSVRKMKAGGISDWLWSKPEAIQYMDEVTKFSKELLLEIDQAGAEGNMRTFSHGIVPINDGFLSLLGSIRKVCASKEWKELQDKKHDVQKVFGQFKSLQKENFRSKWSLWKRVRDKWNKSSWSNLFTAGAKIILLYMLACGLLTWLSWGAYLPFCTALGAMTTSLQASALSLKASTVTKLKGAKNIASKGYALLKCWSITPGEMFKVKIGNVNNMYSWKHRTVSKSMACMVKNGLLPAPSEWGIRTGESIIGIVGGGRSRSGSLVDEIPEYGNIQIEEWGIPEQFNQYEQLFLINLKTVLERVAQNEEEYAKVKWRNKEKTTATLLQWIETLLDREGDDYSKEGCVMKYINDKTTAMNDGITGLMEIGDF